MPPVGSQCCLLKKQAKFLPGNWAESHRDLEASYLTTCVSFWLAPSPAERLGQVTGGPQHSLRSDGIRSQDQEPNSATWPLKEKGEGPGALEKEITAEAGWQQGAHLGKKEKTEGREERTSYKEAEVLVLG